MRSSSPSPNPIYCLPRNLSVARYFTIAGDPDDPCRRAETRANDSSPTASCIKSMPYPDHFDHGEISLPFAHGGAWNLALELVGDETSRLTETLSRITRGDVVTQFVHRRRKADWISKGGTTDFARVDRDGTNAQLPRVQSPRSGPRKTSGFRLAIALAHRSRLRSSGISSGEARRVEFS